MIGDLFGIAFRNISHRKRRSWLTVVGVFIGIAAVVGLVSLGQGLQNSVESEFEQIGSDKLFINPAGSATSYSGRKLNEDDLAAVDSSKTVETATGLIFATTTGEYNDRQEFVTVLGVPGDIEKQKLVKESWALEIDSGRDIESTDSANIVLGSSVAQRHFGSEIGLRENIEVNGKDFRVVGTYKPSGDPSIDQSVTLPFNAAAELIDREDGQYDWILVRIQDGTTPEEAKVDVERALRRERGLEEGEENFSVSTQEDLISSFNSILSIVRGVVIGIASISLLVGAVNIMNTMYTSVTQRTREIGVMKAIGASERQIMTLFLMEAGILGAIGGTIGVAVGVALSTIASYAATEIAQLPINPYLGAELLLGAALFSFIIGMVSGVLPARRAAKMPPAEALRYE
ncbi:ABC transporter permease [Candidatus Nanohalococcus occultus]|uniref:ABC-type antimicrobial peptide transport system,permease component n=1 Tax=Candidatus Nanohalococcus occultus TaxID=2978047 RepID=A0ABY8CJC1_9ARCH|nr:ABC-type antimicrobial peptide transport system,permease component [Candidatus Nanohaloarchaeota archaeon SVXNc]